MMEHGLPSKVVYGVFILGDIQNQTVPSPEL